MDGALITGIYFRDPLETWGSDRVVLLGDAAHPAPPSAGQGAGMALEDAVMLAACLRRAGPGNEPAALREYAFRRQARTTRMLESSRVNLRNSQTSDPVQVRARNGYYRGLERLSPAGPPMQEWLLAHDPVAAAQQSAAEFEQSLAVPANPMRRPEARRAFDLWRTALTGEHRAAGWLGERRGYAEFAAARSLQPGRRGARPAVSVELRRNARAAGRARRRPPDRAPGGAAPARRRLHDGLGRAVGAARRAAGGGGRRLVARARLPARARAPVPRGAATTCSPPTAGWPASTRRPRSSSAASARAAAARARPRPGGVRCVRQGHRECSDVTLNAR